MPSSEQIEAAAKALWDSGACAFANMTRLRKWAAAALEAVEELEEIEWEYGVASYGDLEDVLLDPVGEPWTEAEVAQRWVNADYGDVVVRRSKAGPWERIENGETNA